MIRKLSNVEKDIFRKKNNKPIFFATVARIIPKIKKENFVKLLPKLSNKYPLFSVRVNYDDKRQPFFSNTNVADFNIQTIIGKEDNDWVNIVENDLMIPFSLNKGPYVRFILIQFNEFTDLIITFHHGISDGLSAILILRDIVILLDNPTIELNNNPIIPFFTDLIPNKIKDYIINISKKELEKGLNSYKKREFTNEIIDMIKPFKYILIAWSLSREQTQALIIRAREEKTSVHSALNVAFLRAFAQFYGINENWKRILQSPINFRPFLSKGVENALGLFVSIIRINVNCSLKRNFWDIAREIKNKI
ncbi:MAG: hypothetical protein JXA99_12590 [Candidatus Lokiarchaeota archaeon]|nr:hypothetical protein [Candidatus Lokiarchaeota archaeon]